MKMNKLLLTPVLILSCVLATHAAVSLPPIFSDGMVLQRDMPVPVWGWAEPGDQVEVTFAGQIKSATTDSTGRWQVTLDAMPASFDPQTLTVSAKNLKSEISNFRCTDVLVGEVWVGCGQSNMAIGSAAFLGADPALAIMVATNYPALRLLTTPGGKWRKADAGSNKGYSALMFSFGQPLQKELNVPVGLIVGASSGQPSGRWLTPAALAADQPCQGFIRKSADTNAHAIAMQKYQEAVAAWEKTALGVTNKAALPPRPKLPLQVGEFQIKLGDLFELQIRPLIPFAIRGVLWDQGESGTAIHGLNQYLVMGALIRGWRKEWGLPPATGAGAPGGDFPFLYVQKPSGGGCAWTADAATTNHVAPTNLFKTTPQFLAANHPYARGIHISIMNYPNTAMVISSDLTGGLHPPVKSAYGARACRVALGKVYGKPVEYYGPVYQSHKIEGNKIRIAYTHVGQGLAICSAPKLQGFVVAGDDRKFVWADAVIDGDTVVVSSDKVDKPVAVRYAWTTERRYDNLFNKDGLPAIPFKSDTW